MHTEFFVGKPFGRLGIRWVDNIKEEFWEVDCKDGK
jgi:hypothetical protein